MGIFDFVKDAGEKLLGGDEGANDRTADKASGRDEANQKKVNALIQAITSQGLQVDDLRLTFSDGTATVSGKTDTQADKEKVILTIGNTRGVARVDDRIEVVNPEPEATMYTVKSGDTLSEIAQAQYGDAGAYMRIFEANRPLLKDPDEIYPGQVLRIPSKAAAPA